MAELYDTASAVVSDTALDPLEDTGNADGSVGDMQGRLWRLLPVSWFPYSTADAPVLMALLGGIATTLNTAWQMLLYARQSSRMATAPSEMLDMAASDLFGSNGLPRRTSETDASYLARIQAAIIAPKNTRSAVTSAVTAAAAPAVAIIECWNPQDCGFYVSGQTGVPGYGGYGTAGCAWSGTPGQVFLTVTAPTAQVYAEAVNAIAATKAVGVLAWCRQEV